MKKPVYYIPLIIAVLIAVFLLMETANHSSDHSAPDSLHFTQVEIKVSGMFCNGCAGMIEAKLKKINGVSTAFASYPDSNVLVTFDSILTNQDSLAHAIEVKGYGVKEIIKGLSLE